MKKYLLLASFLFIFGLALITSHGRPELAVYFFDIGQGDGVLITTPAGAAILIDGGPSRKILSQISDVLPFFKKNIDLSILTHPHADHLTGNLAVMERYRVDKVLATGVLHTIDEYSEWLSIIKNEQIPWQQAKAGDSISFSDGVKFDILFPISDLSGREVDDLNSTSVTVKLSYGQTRALFTGDITAENESEIIRNNGDISAQLLKVPHHGSRTSSTPEFIKAVNPQWAVISAGLNNSFGHPHAETLLRYKVLGVEILRTDQDGTIKFVSDGQVWRRQ